MTNSHLRSRLPTVASYRQFIVYPIHLLYSKCCFHTVYGTVTLVAEAKHDLSQHRYDSRRGFRYSCRYVVGHWLERKLKEAQQRCKGKVQGASHLYRKSEAFKEWLFTVEEAIGIFQPMNPVGYAASFLEGSARQWLIP